MATVGAVVSTAKAVLAPAPMSVLPAVSVTIQVTVVGPTGTHLARLGADHPHLPGRQRRFRSAHRLSVEAPGAALGVALPQVPRPRRIRLPAS